MHFKTGTNSLKKGLLITTIVGSLLCSTYARNLIWHEQIILWKDVVKKSPKKARGHHILGYIYESEELIDKAIEHYEIAMKLDPYNYISYYNLGNANFLKGNLSKSIEYYTISILLKPDNSDTHTNLAVAYEESGMIMDALIEYREALKINPQDHIARNNIERLLSRK